MATKINYDFHDRTELSVLPLGDIHFGSSQCNIAYAMKMINAVEADPDCTVILLGDLMDCALFGSKSDAYDATCIVQDQVENIAKIMRKLAEQGKILAVLEGNHEQRVMRSAGIKPNKMMCEILGISDRYCPTNGLVDIKLGKKRYIIYCTHSAGGSGGGKLIGAKANSLAALGNNVSTGVGNLIFCSAHTHQPMVFRNEQMSIDPKTGKERMIDRLFVNCGSCLNYGGHGEIGGYIPSSNNYPLVILNSNKLRTHVLM